MREETRQLIKNFNLKRWDFMGYTLIKPQATFHHIVKREHGGKYSLDNGAVLMPDNHQYLHLIEEKDIELFYFINGVLKAISMRGYVTDDDYKLIADMLYSFETNHRNDKRSNGRRLIKYEYTHNRKYLK